MSTKRIGNTFVAPGEGFIILSAALIVADLLIDSVVKSGIWCKAC